MKRPPSNFRLTEDEKNFVFSLIENVTGTCQKGVYRREILATNVERRIRYVGASSLAGYLAYAERDPAEGKLLLSALTIHTTSWFRESPHFQKLEADIRRRIIEQKIKFVRVLCAGCSSGEEAYSIALVLEKVRIEHPGFDYNVEGVDIDPISVAHAGGGVFGGVAFSLIPEDYRKFCLVGRASVSGFFTLSGEIRRRTSFKVGDIRSVAQDKGGAFDFIFCRNVLIYFSPDDVERMVKGLVANLKVDGTLYLGHSEAVEAGRIGLRFVGDSTYIKRRVLPETAGGRGAVCRVLVVEDSSAVRRTIERTLERSGIVTFGVASVEEASEFLEKRTVDVVTLDVMMPGLEGSMLLNSSRLAGLGVPVVIVSENAPSQVPSIVGALESGAQDFIEKSQIEVDGFAERILAISKSYRRSFSSRFLDGGIRSELSKVGGYRDRPDVILVGASTGGTEAVMRLLTSLPSDCPPVLLVQHISAYFAHAFAERVAQNSKLRPGGGADGTLLEAGHIYVADEDRHLGICSRRGRLAVVRSDGPPVNRHRPSVDFLFTSAAAISNIRASAILLTGMGADGAQGMLELHDKGCVTFAQDEQSCVVFGMPKEAIALGAVDVVASPSEIRKHLDCQLAGKGNGGGLLRGGLARRSGGKSCNP